MAKMHENELEIDEGLVHKLLKNQCSHWANLLINPILSSGTDNALFRLGSEYVVRLPRIEWAPGSINKSINKEYEWIPKIARLLKISVSEPLFKGNPEEFYPWVWTVTKWNEGHNPNFEEDKEYELLAKDLALFLNDLHEIKLSDGPTSRRGIPLKTKELDEETRKAIGELEGEIDLQSIASLWNQLSNVPYWNKEPVWVHGDFLPGNILVQGNRLNAVIDFSDLGIGDPACDLVIAWSLLNSHSRRIFRENLQHIDDDTWERGKGWALSIALIMLPYYKNSNPVLATLARRMLENVKEKKNL
ncbi:aminoglycoside phosphotransferase family protein [Legionella fallonii]|uniref:Aminoglycoside phosphotransferase domain-containing protein n=1 Tax=Legionella fallonii LLAP-10 TaxID=1212491 RepID=A0A098G8Q6_9GAMM|nr:aminoglycoside phosphotransferase family protein [Legionella fallonii]CEG57855.1 conserved protein of unknown function [Legionella fallonii LLAP-10]